MKRKKKINPLSVFCTVLVAASALAVAGLWGQRIYRQKYDQTHVEIGGEDYEKDVTALTLTSLEEVETVMEMENLETLDARAVALSGEQYEALRAALPGCEILWNPPFQGQRYSQDSASFTISYLTEQDIGDLAYFPNLAEIDATECTDYAELAQLMEIYPECSVTYFIHLGEERYAPDAQSLTLEGADITALAASLPYFTALETVELTGELPPAEELIALTQAETQVSFTWSVTILGESYASDTTELDFSGTEIDSVEEIENGAAYLPNLTKVIMCNCGIDNETMDALNRRHEDVQYVWSVQLGEWYEVRTDDTEFMPAKAETTYLLRTADAYNLRYCTEMVGIDLGHHLISNIDFVEFMPHLRYLIIGDTQVSDLSPLENLTELAYLEMFGTKVTDYTPLLGCTGLEDLNISYTMGDPEIIAQMTWLKRLWWRCPDDWCISYSQEQMLIAALPDCTTSFGEGSSTGFGWRTGGLYYDMRDFFGVDYMSG